jgi:hypothetical protein
MGGRAPEIERPKGKCGNVWVRRASDCRFLSARHIWPPRLQRHNAIAAVKPFFPRVDASNLELGGRRHRAANISGSLDLRAVGRPTLLHCTVSSPRVVVQFDFRMLLLTGSRSLLVLVLETYELFSGHQDITP